MAEYEKKVRDVLKKMVAILSDMVKVIFGGRLGEYKYYDMDQVIAAALEKAKMLLNKT